jgi:hypothetical protein
MSGDWRVFRPAIWLAMLGIALIVVVRPPYIGAAVLGAAIGIALRIGLARRRASARRRGSAGAPRPPRRSRRD